MIRNLFFAFLITLSLALGWLRLNDYFAHKGWMSGRTSRKVIHMGTGPIFVLCWLLFPENPWSRYVAAIIPLLITIQFAMVGFGIIRDQAAVQAMSRNGDRKEILRGPLFYGIVFVVLTIWFWKDSSIGIVALMLLCGGDGLADLVGNRFGKIKLPWSKNKSIAGSLAVFLGGWFFAIFIIGIYLLARVWDGNLISFLLPITLISFVGTAVESLPFRDIDNLTVPVVAIIFGYFFLP